MSSGLLLNDEPREIGAANDERCLRLRRALRAATGFRLILIEIERGEVRHEVLRRIEGWRERGDIGQIEFVYSHSAGGLLEASEWSPPGLVLLDLDDVASAGDDAALTISLQTLNWERDRLPNMLKGPLVLVLDRRGTQRLLEVAPDLASWRKYSFHFDETARSDFWTLEGAAPWHTILAHEVRVAPTATWLALLAEPVRSTIVTSTSVVRAIRTRGQLAMHEDAEAIYQAARGYPWSPRELAAIEVAGGHAALDRRALDDFEQRRAAARSSVAQGGRRSYGTFLEEFLLEGRRALVMHDLARARDAYRSAVVSSHRRQDAVVRTTALVGLAVVTPDDDGGERRDEFLREADSVAKAARTDWLEYYVAIAKAWASRGSQALRHFDAAYQLAAQAGSPEAVETALRAATEATAVHDQRAAETWLRRAAPASTPGAPAWMQQTYWRLEAVRATRLGHHAQALALQRRVRAIDPQSATSPLDVAMGRVAMLAGEPRVALESFERARDVGVARADPVAVAHAEVGIGRARLVLSERVDEAEAALRRASEFFSQRRLHAAEAEARRHLSDALATLGRHDESAEQRAQAEALAEVLGASIGTRPADDQ